MSFDYGSAVIAQLGLDEHKLTEQDANRLDSIIAVAEYQLAFKLGLDINEGDQQLEALAHVVVGVAVKRWNRFKNEGMASYSQEGESITYENDDFAEYDDDISEWKRRNGQSVMLTVDPYRKREQS
ncbi:phage head-tail connector protein [Limosilactobacillus equigenerosi]|uniref:Phage protein n=1 Tax=Limosilactobacillus equigenerosi DSM 18793 = JCM 14505 TaxID=1423742 RepID=A0A0R1V181_9LACO|nr:phage head-tail connector protein [Limosilactobacillus equigenerosi]KRL96565.1 hypothetical protein FC21_GL000649 [Limosilactobacillus equigenerosi DSM 18793 = JCM 14505]